jgi:hypothetical protein
MRPHPSLVLIPLLWLAGCSPDEDAPSGTSTGTSAEAHVPVLGDVAADGSCDPGIIDIDHEHPTMALIWNIPDGYPEAELTTTVHFTDPARGTENGGGMGYGGGGSRVSLVTGTPNEDIDHIEVTATTDNGTTETCTIDVA